jgi:hypothetical protein
MAESLPPLSVGEVVEAEIMEGTRHGKTLILLKNSAIRVHSETPLVEGKKIAVRVTRLHPGVILRIVQGGVPERAGLIDHLRLFRSNPKALSDLLAEGATRFSPEKLGVLASHLGKEDVENMQNIFKSLIFSKDSLKAPDFFRNYVHTLGYLMEQKLGEALKKRSGRAEYLRDASQSLKGLLAKVSDRLQPLIEMREFPTAERLAGFVRSSLQAINSHQVVNYLFQEHEGTYMFQIPFLFQENRGMAEIFVKFGERDSGGKGNHEGKNVLFLLDMDALGEVVAEATVEAQKIRCVLKCSDADSRDFVTSFLGELGESLAAVGYDVEHLQCVVNQKDLSEVRDTAYRAFERLFPAEGVDLLA